MLNLEVLLPLSVYRIVTTISVAIEYPHFAPFLKLWKIDIWTIHYWNIHTTCVFIAEIG